MRDRSDPTNLILIALVVLALSLAAASVLVPGFLDMGGGSGNEGKPLLIESKR